MILPGLVDVHVHLRVPGGEHKEDFRTGTAAGLAGGFTTLMAMPNTRPPLVTPDAYSIAQSTSSRDSLCDVFLFAGASENHLADQPALAQLAPALKLYLDETYGELHIKNLQLLSRIALAWPPHKVIALHAEGNSIAFGIALATAFNRPVHICHVSRKSEIEQIAFAKARWLPVTCEVTPHHLFLTKADAARLGPFGDMRPTLASQEDVDTLWQHINTTIDCIASDHAPHTLEEKDSAENPPPGVPGLESTLPLMLTAVAEGRLSISRLVELLYTNPLRIFNLPKQPDTRVEVEEHAHYTFPDHPLYTRCGWSPFSGFEMRGRIRKVIFKGSEVVRDGSVLTFK